MTRSSWRRRDWAWPTAFVAVLVLICSSRPVAAGTFEGKYFRGEGDEGYLRLLDIARRMMDPDPEFQNLSMLYTPAWNGFVEGPTWGAWWIQNSYGTTYCALPALQEPYITFLQNAQDLWFNQMGDGQRAGANNWVAPDGCLCDAASPGWIVYKQGDGRTDIHDWGVEFTAAGLVLQAELLLISRDREALQHYLPLLERCAAFVESRRDPRTNLFRAGPAGNLLAPSYAGQRREDGNYDQAFLVGLSVTYIAALDRLIELEKLVGNTEKVQVYVDQRKRAGQGLSQVTTEDGYLLKSLDPDGTRHGVFGAEKHGYFEAVCNHDAICFGVVPDEQARRIMDKIRSIPGLRPHDLIITNYPSLDDMYVPADTWLWQFGTWVNGGHWTTCEARMIMAYCRLDYFEDAARSMQQILKFARLFRLDNPLVDFGNAVYQPNEPVNLCYDSFGAPAALVRGLFEYVYRADGLTLIPHIPPGITRLQQDFPIRLGHKQIYLATVGNGPITAVTVNGEPWSRFDARTVNLVHDEIPDEAVIVVALGSAAPVALTPRRLPTKMPDDFTPPSAEMIAELFPTISGNDLPLRIGADSAGNNRFVGQLARARLFQRALSVDEVAASARNEASELDHDAALVADWHFGQCVANSVPNAVNEHLAAQVVGEAELVDGPAGKVLQLRGAGYLEVAPDPRLNLDRAGTLEAWLRCETLPASGARILDKSRVGTSNGYLLDTMPGNSLRLIVARGSLGHDAKLPTDRWSHVAASVDVSGRLSLFVDGQQVATAQPESPVDAIDVRVARLRRFHQSLVAAGFADSYEAHHTRLALECYAVAWQRQQLLADGRLTRLEPASQLAADTSYYVTAARLYEGLEKTIAGYANSEDACRQQIHAMFVEEPSHQGDAGRE